MADVEHSVLTGSDLHEPKGVAAASSGQVYVADGATSGAWSTISGSTTITVEVAADFPAASGGLRTLAANTTYVVVGSVSIGSDRLAMSANTVLRGQNQSSDTVVSTTTGTLVTATAVSCRVYKLGFTCSSGAFIAVSGSSNVHSFREVNATCDTGGTVAGTLIFDLWRSNISCNTTGITFSGSCGKLSVQDSTVGVTTAAGICLDLGVTTFDSIKIRNATINNAASVTGIDIAPAGANLNTGSIGFITQTDFQTSASSTAGFTHGEIRWTMVNNVGLANNSAAGDGYIVDSALSTTFTGTGAGNEVVVNFGTAFLPGDHLHKFSLSTSGLFTYLGETSITMFVQYNSFGVISGGAARTYNWYLAKNGTISLPTVTQHEYDGTNPGTVSGGGIFDLEQNDTLQLYVRAETATTTMVADTVGIQLVQAGA